VGWAAWLDGSRSWLVNRISRRELMRGLEPHLGGRLIDIGCGTKPLAAWSRGKVARHVGIDHPAGLHGPSGVDAYASAYRTPFRDASFDAAVCSAVLEHLEEPEAALRECFRLLKPGGVAAYTVPFIWHVHEEPRDFYRYSKYGMAYLLKKAGFEVLEVRALSGFWLTFGQLLVYNLFRCQRGPLRYLPLIPLLGLALQGAFYALDRLDRTERWTWAYLALARKPA
jgi:SAM-dependent methyltransferase